MSEYTIPADLDTQFRAVYAKWPHEADSADALRMRADIKRQIAAIYRLAAPRTPSDMACTALNLAAQALDQDAADDEELADAHSAYAAYAAGSEF